MAIRSGLMRARITVQRSTTTRNEYNQKGVEWETVLDNVRARKRWIKGNENAERSGNVEHNYWEFQIRYIAGLSAENRILSDGKIYNIFAIHNVNDRNHELLISCHEHSRQTIRGI